MAGAGRPDRIGPFLGAAGGLAHALCEPVATDSQFFPYLAGAARGSIGAGLVRGHGRSALDPARRHARQGDGLAGAVGDGGRYAGHGTGAVPRPGRANHGQLHPGARIPTVSCGPGGVRHGGRPAGVAQPAGRTPAGTTVRRRRRAGLRPEHGRRCHGGRAAVPGLVVGRAADDTG